MREKRMRKRYPLTPVNTFFRSKVLEKGKKEAEGRREREKEKRKHGNNWFWEQRDLSACLTL